MRDWNILHDAGPDSFLIRTWRTDEAAMKQSQMTHSQLNRLTSCLSGEHALMERRRAGTEGGWAGFEAELFPKFTIVLERHGGNTVVPHTHAHTRVELSARTRVWALKEDRCF